MLLEAGTQDGIVTVDCRNDGHGIPEEVRDKMFDPLFTTVPPYRPPQPPPYGG